MTYLRAGVSLTLAMLVAGTAAIGCGGSVTSGTGTGGGPGTGGSSGTGGGYAGSTGGGAGITPPLASSAKPNTSGTETVIAISYFFLGNVNLQGEPDPNAWKSIGYNLDGLLSKPGDTNHCKLQPGANPLDVETDGNGGIDNSFGANLMPLMTSEAATPAGTTNGAISDGSSTELFRLDKLTTAPDQNGVTGALYAGANKGSPALFNGTDVWPVTYESVNNGNLNAPKVKFPNSYVSGGVWVSGSEAQFVLPLMVQGYTMNLPISQAIFSMQLKGAGTQAAAFNGVIAGVIDIEAFVSELKRIAGSFDPSLCNGFNFDSIAQQIRAASDIMSDGTNGDPGKTCNAISIGLGFKGSAVKLGAVAPPVPPPPDPCAP